MTDIGDHVPLVMSNGLSKAMKEEAKKRKRMEFKSGRRCDKRRAFGFVALFYHMHHHAAIMGIKIFVASALELRKSHP
jgi:hypothetical protein